MLIDREKVEAELKKMFERYHAGNWLMVNFVDAIEKHVDDARVKIQDALNGGDELLPAARRILKRATGGKLMILQNRLEIGYVGAAKLISIIETPPGASGTPSA